MSDTPRTDKWKRRATEFDPRCPVVHAGHVDELERRLIRALASGDWLADALRCQDGSEKSQDLAKEALSNWEEVKGDLS